jgi:hypothetical protein
VPDETFDFPGLAIGLLYSARTGQARLGYRPSKIKRKLRRIHALTAEAMGQQETTALAGKLNCMLRGWANYFVEIQAEVQGAGTVVNTDVLFGYGVGSSGVVASFAGLEMNGDSGDQSQTLSTTLAFTVFMEQGDVIEAFAEGGPEVVSAIPVPPGPLALRFRPAGYHWNRQEKASRVTVTAAFT